MPGTIERPIYYEGQILAANDLAQGLDYARDQDARHERYLHTWGIAEGLSVVQRGDDFILQPGFAVDSSGATIVVPTATVLDPQRLKDDALLSSDDAGHFPVFVSRTEGQSSTTREVGGCASAESTRREESYAIRYRRIATGWDEKQEGPPVSEGPEDREESDRAVLIGFLEWTNEDNGKIVDFARRNGAIGPRYAGVRADELLGRGGTLTVRSRAAKTADAPMVVVDEHSDKKTFVFGLDDGDGRINEVFTVDKKGNVKAKGDITADARSTGRFVPVRFRLNQGSPTTGWFSLFPRTSLKGTSIVSRFISASPHEWT